MEALSFCSRSWRAGGSPTRLLWLIVAIALALLLPNPDARASTFEVIHHFTGSDPGDGNFADAPLTFDLESEGVLYGVTYSLGGIYKLTKVEDGQPWQRELLHRFEHGGYTQTGLTWFRGKLYGMTDGDNPGRTGTVYEFDPETLVYRVIFDFDRNPGRFGALPQSPLLAWRGALWGTTTQDGRGGGGTIFRLTPPEASATDWTMKVLKSFRGPNGFNGGRVGLTARKGSLFGGTFSGGRESDGVVFQLRESEPGSDKWVQTVLSSFRGDDDASSPESPLLLSQDRLLYGTAQSDTYLHQGIIFRMRPKQGRFVRETIFRFHGGSDSGYPAGRLVEDSRGRLYGVTSGSYPDLGTVYRLFRPTAANPNWRLETLRRFRGRDGRAPKGGLLLRETDGQIVLYGTASEGGDSDSGTAFMLTLP